MKHEHACHPIIFNYTHMLLLGIPFRRLGMRLSVFVV